MTTIYPNLAAEMVLRGISLSKLAKELGESYKSVRFKYIGQTPITLIEAKRIQKIVNPRVPIEILFSTEAVE